MLIWNSCIETAQFLILDNSLNLVIVEEENLMKHISVVFLGIVRKHT